LALPDNLQVNRILFTETWPCLLYTSRCV
ncbi:hypothetical protein AZ010_001360, partial [Klebsiella pneumoniae]